MTYKARSLAISGLPLGSAAIWPSSAARLLQPVPDLKFPVPKATSPAGQLIRLGHPLPSWQRETDLSAIPEQVESGSHAVSFCVTSTRRRVSAAALCRLPCWRLARETLWQCQPSSLSLQVSVSYFSLSSYFLNKRFRHVSGYRMTSGLSFGLIMNGICRIRHMRNRADEVRGCRLTNVSRR